MYREIGERFEYFDTVSEKTVELVVEETEASNFSCKGCYFAHLKDICNFQCYMVDRKVTGECVPVRRFDKKVILFRRITKAQIERDEAEKKAKKEERKRNRRHRWLQIKNILLGITEKDLLEIARQQWNKQE